MSMIKLMLQRALSTAIILCVIVIGWILNLKVNHSESTNVASASTIVEAIDAGVRSQALCLVRQCVPLGVPLQVVHP